jgi:hypothetical protein
MVLEIEDDYNSILKEFQRNLAPVQYTAYGERADCGFAEVTEQDLLSLIRRIMNFQRKIEYSINTAKKLLSNVFDSGRLIEICNKLIDRLCDEKRSYEELSYNDANYNVMGVIPLLKISHKSFLQLPNSKACLRNAYSAYHGFKLLKSILIELEEELRLVSALTTYPIEKITVLKNQLVVNDFEDVAISLEESESNLENEHFKDCVSRCRDALEFFIAQIRQRKTGEKTERHFATDLGKIAKIEVFDEATQKLAQGVYSYLSLKGSHKYDSSKVSIYDAETALKETYSLIEMLLKKLLEYKKHELSK